eukprot:35239_1
MDPTRDPTKDPASDPTMDPTMEPTMDPTLDSTLDPTLDPTRDPTKDPTLDPTMDPTREPTADPTHDPWIIPEDSAAQLLAVEVHAIAIDTEEIESIHSVEIDETYTVEEISDGEFLYEFVGLEALRVSDGNHWVKDMAHTVLNQLNRFSIYRSSGNSLRTFDWCMNGTVLFAQLFVILFCISF